MTVLVVDVMTGPMEIIVVLMVLGGKMENVSITNHSVQNSLLILSVIGVLFQKNLI